MLTSHAPASASAGESANPNTDEDFAFALALAGELKPKRDSRAPERFTAEKNKKKSAGADGGAAERPTCACGAQEEPSKAGTFVFCNTCGVFLSLGGPVRCVCAQAVPPQANAGAEDEMALDDADDDAADVLWIQCDRCKHYLHAKCVWGDAVPEDLSQRAFVCLLCDDDDNDADDADEDHDHEDEAEGDAGVAVAGTEQNRDEQEENRAELPDGEERPPAKKARSWFWVCGLNGCNYASIYKTKVRVHIKNIHKKSTDDADAAPTKVLGDVLPERVCQHCGKKNASSFHIARCPALLAEPREPSAAAVDEPAAVAPAAVAGVANSIPVPAPAPLVVAASAFPPSRLRVPEWQKRAQAERARREALVRKIRALEQLDEAFLASMSALYADRKLASEI
jgi:hypothetical protein